MYPLARVLQRAGHLYPERTAIIDGPTHLTYRELAIRVHRLAGALKRLGLQRGDRIALLDVNSQRYLEAYYASAHAGLVLVPVNSRLAPRELQYILRDCGARALLLSEQFVPTYEEIKAGTPSIEMAIGMGLRSHSTGIFDYEDLVAGADPAIEPIHTDLDEIALIYYTSGTTGDPKGVCLSNRSMFAGGVDGLMACNISAYDRWLHAGPLFHLATCFAVWSMPLVGAAQSVMHFDAKRLAEVMLRDKTTMTCLPGAILGMVADLLERQNCELDALRCVLYGGSPTPLGVLRNAHRVLPPSLTHAYGITEMAGFVSALSPQHHVFSGGEDELRRTVSAGQPTPLVEVRIVDEEGRALGTDQVGEIVCAGPKVFSGYWNKPEATKSALRGGWYHTGDLGSLSKDHFLTVVDRKKDMIISGGENVYSIEVESVLSTHPHVGEVAVIGIPDDHWGEIVMAIIVARDTAPDEEELKAFCRGKIAGYKIPKRIEIRSEPLPKSGPGKIAKRILREPFWEGAGRAI